MAKQRTPQFDVHEAAGPGGTDSGAWLTDETADDCFLEGVLKEL